MEATTTLREAVDAYAKARTQRQDAVQAIFNEIKGLLDDAGLEAGVIVHGSNALNTFTIEVHLPDDRGVHLDREQSTQEIPEEPEPVPFAKGRPSRFPLRG